MVRRVCFPAPGLAVARTGAGPKLVLLMPAPPMSAPEFSDAELLDLTTQHFPLLAGPDIELAPILKGGSDRRYYRLRKHGRPLQLILVRYTDARADNACFFPATEILMAHGVKVPKVFHHDAGRKLAWIEDLGALDLWALQESPWAERRQLYSRTLEEVARLHRMRPEDLPADTLAQLMSGFTEDLYLWEQNYFFDNFATHFSAATPAERQEVRHSEALAALRRDLGALPRTFIHRDFQSQNVIIRDHQPYFIDYQGLRPGRPEYDVASLLYDPYVAFTPGQRDELWAEYQALRAGDPGWETSDHRFAQCAVQRLMQALGAYGNLAFNLGRPEFFEHVPRAVENLTHVINRSGVATELLPLLKLRPDVVE
jgi:aminoglycoside/choline kinase family phosphotransferase